MKNKIIFGIILFIQIAFLIQVIKTHFYYNNIPISNDVFSEIYEENNLDAPLENNANDNIIKPHCTTQTNPQNFKMSYQIENEKRY
jgi:hypothetical protein